MKKFTTIGCIFFSLTVGLLSFAEEIKTGRMVYVRITGVSQEERSRIDGNYTVGDDGSVKIPHIGKIVLAGMKLEDASHKIEEAFRNAKVFAIPQIQLSIVYSDGVIMGPVTVIGFVRKTGPIKYVPSMTLANAIAAAGGVNEGGNAKKIIVMRGKSAKFFDLQDADNQKFLLQPDDNIEVPSLISSPVR